MHKEYALQWNTEEFSPEEKIYQGCTVYDSYRAPRLINEFIDKEMALEALKNYKSKIVLDDGIYEVTEYFVEEYDVENGNCVENSDGSIDSVWYFAEFDESSKKLIGL